MGTRALNRGIALSMGLVILCDLSNLRCCTGEHIGGGGDIFPALKEKNVSGHGHLPGKELQKGLK